MDLQIVPQQFSYVHKIQTLNFFNQLGRHWGEALPQEESWLRWLLVLLLDVLGVACHLYRVYSCQDSRARSLALSLHNREV